MTKHRTTNKIVLFINGQQKSYKTSKLVATQTTAQHENVLDQSTRNLPTYSAR